MNDQLAPVTIPSPMPAMFAQVLAAHDGVSDMHVSWHSNAEYGIIRGYEKPHARGRTRRGDGSSLKEMNMNSIASKTPSIYQIRHIESGKVYVGSATNPRRRRQEHRSALRKGTHHSPYLQRAWNKHGESAFVFEIIEPVLFVEDLVNREQYWIDTLRAADTKYGFNISPTAGSTIGVKRSAEVRARKSEQTKAQFADPDVRAKVAEQTKAQFADPDARARRAASQKKLWEDPLYRAKMSARQKERFARPDERARMSEQAKAEWRDPEVRAKITDGAKERTEKQWADPEFRAGMVDRAKTRWADPEFRARYPKHHKKREAKE